jgi:ketosteroid isomerase-like protein
MGTTRFRHALMLAIALLAGSGVAASAQVAAPARTALPGSPPLDSATLAANRRIDQAFLDAHLVKDPAAVLRLYSRRPDVVFIAPNGTINRGHAAITGSFNLLFPNVESMRGEVREVTYHRVSDSVVATAGSRCSSASCATAPRRAHGRLDGCARAGGRRVALPVPPFPLARNRRATTRVAAGGASRGGPAVPRAHALNGASAAAGRTPAAARARPGAGSARCRRRLRVRVAGVSGAMHPAVLLRCT